MENKPPEADAMERAGTPQEIAADWTPKPVDRMALAMEIADYGDQRAHAAHMAAYREGLQRLSDERKRAREAESARLAAVRVCKEQIIRASKAEQTAREARAAAIEEAAQIMPDNYKFSDYPDQQSSARHGVAVFRRMIRALADTPPQSEGKPNPFHHCDDCSDQDCYAFGCKRYGRSHRVEPTETLPDGSKFRQQDV